MQRKRDPNPNQLCLEQSNSALPIEQEATASAHARRAPSEGNGIDNEKGETSQLFYLALLFNKEPKEMLLSRLVC